MDHSYSDIRSKIIFFQPSDRQNFANALGQTCIHDLRLRLNESGQKWTKVDESGRKWMKMVESG